MFSWAIIFLLLAIVAGALGFGLIAGVTWQLGKILLVVFLILLVISLVTGRRVPRV
jgi:uncharacterized membrane protein YtjA (UPF0391 family)